VPVQSATVVSGSVSTTTQFKRVGIKLRVVPQQVSGDMALLEINPEVSAVTGFTAAGAGGVSNPIVAIRNVSTTALLRDGEVLTIGGLLRSEDRDIIRKVPLLGDIPGLGVLFQSRRSQSVKTQLIFFLRINILDRGRTHTLRFHKPGAGLGGLDEEVERLTPQPRDLDPLKVPSRGTTKPLAPESAVPEAAPPSQSPAGAPKPAPAGATAREAPEVPKP
jgi:general secretion pathway protein D